MKRLTNIVIGLDDEARLKEIAAKAAGLKISEVAAFHIVKRSVDARHKDNIKLVFTVDIGDIDKPQEIYKIKPINAPFEYPPIVVGFGPAGMFAADALAETGACPIVLERGESYDARQKRVNLFWQKGYLDTESNVQFGEGGAGAFSDGKLNTGTSDAERQFYVLNKLVAYGAPENILYDGKPHIGTDKLGEVVIALRKNIERLGGEVKFNSCVQDIIPEKDGVRILADKEYFTRHLIIAVGHSARDTFRMLDRRGFAMQAKPFAVGVRIEHLQKDIDRAMFGSFAGHAALGAADYKLVRHTASGGVYSFCMCPGGSVIASSCEKDTVVTNGMSISRRDGVNANAAILSGVTAADYGEELFDGMEYQEKLERAAFQAGGGNYYAPCQLLGDYVKGRSSNAFGKILPTYLPGTRFYRLDRLLGERIGKAFGEALVHFGRIIEGYSIPDAVLTGVETRSSSPLRVLRGEDRKSISSPYVYPAGEGCGYAGGIMSAAVDGLLTAEIITKLQ